MKEELDKKLVEDHPSLCKNRYGDMRETCMCWGFSCGDGWYKLLDELFTKIDQIAPNKVTLDQVKEKFGGLRVYYTYHDLEPNWWDKMPTIFYNSIRHLLPYKMSSPVIRFLKRIGLRSTYDRISDAVDKAEDKSYETCEWCGEPGIQRGGSWIRTLCTGCNELNKQGKEPWKVESNRANR